MCARTACYFAPSWLDSWLVAHSSRGGHQSLWPITPTLAHLDGLHNFDKAGGTRSFIRHNIASNNNQQFEIDADDTNSSSSGNNNSTTPKDLATPPLLSRLLAECQFELELRRIRDKNGCLAVPRNATASAMPPTMQQE